MGKLPTPRRGAKANPERQAESGGTTRRSDPVAEAQVFGMEERFAERYG